MYRDLNSHNFLLDSNGYLKLNNFKFAKVMKENEKTYSICGLPDCLAPEVILNKGTNQ